MGFHDKIQSILGFHDDKKVEEHCSRFWVANVRFDCFHWI